ERRVDSNELELERRRVELENLDDLIRTFQRQREGIAKIIEGLLLIVDGVEDSANANVIFDPMSPDPKERELRTLEAAVLALQRLGQGEEKTAMELLPEASKIAGRTLNYQTLYKALRADSEKTRGARVYKRGEKFGLVTSPDVTRFRKVDPFKFGTNE
ncbi:MAG TPA: hypothetical protein VN181_03385, partial [Thermoanaerobaculia bacterium]|nr:hypothetical protein [Thermoanaerobaculia bacterium]